MASLKTHTNSSISLALHDEIEMTFFHGKKPFNPLFVLASEASGFGLHIRRSRDRFTQYKISEALLDSIEDHPEDAKNQFIALYNTMDKKRLEAAPVETQTTTPVMPNGSLCFDADPTWKPKTDIKTYDPARLWDDHQKKLAERMDECGTEKFVDELLFDILCIYPDGHPTKDVLLAIMSVPASASSVESFFSMVNCTLTAKRSNLNDSTIQGLLGAKYSNKEWRWHYRKYTELYQGLCLTSYEAYTDQCKERWSSIDESSKGSALKFLNDTSAPSTSPKKGNSSPGSPTGSPPDSTDSSLMDLATKSTAASSPFLASLTQTADSSSDSPQPPHDPFGSSMFKPFGWRDQRTGEDTPLGYVEWVMKECGGVVKQLRSLYGKAIPVGTSLEATIRRSDLLRFFPEDTRLSRAEMLMQLIREVAPALYLDEVVVPALFPHSPQGPPVVVVVPDPPNEGQAPPVVPNSNSSAIPKVVPPEPKFHNGWKLSDWHTLEDHLEANDINILEKKKEVWLTTTVCISDSHAY